MADINDKPRDAEGRFVDQNTDPAKTVKTTFETTGPINVITKPTTDNFDEPLVSVKIQNPFKKILHWLNDIRKHQTTHFSFKIDVPLYALPVFLTFLAGMFQLFFSLGKAQEKQTVAAIPTPTPIIIIQATATPAPILISRMGTIKATYQVAALLSPTTTITTQEPNEASSSATIEPSATPTPIPTRYVLVKGEDVIFLVTPTEAKLEYYQNKRVLITGLYDRITNTVKINKISDIEVLP